MQKRKTSIFALVAALCVVLSVALFGVVAKAEGEGNTLTVVATNSTEAAFVEDIKKADTVVDVYKVADAVASTEFDTYDYVNWDKAFAGLETDFQTVSKNRESKAEDWQSLYADMAAAASGATPVVEAEPLTDGQVDLNLEDGLYLVLAHGAKADEAFSETYKYTFPPTMVALPSKTNDGEMTNPIYTDTNAGEWETEITILLKSERAPLFGDLVINKEVLNFEGEKATFVFEVTGTNALGGALDTMYAAITYPDQTTTTLTHIPAGSTVTVNETTAYEGARYKHVSGDGSTAVIVAEELVSDQKPVATVSFVNEPDGDHTQGHGVENHFTYNEQSGDWDWEARPATAQE